MQSRNGAAVLILRSYAALNTEGDLIEVDGAQQNTMSALVHNGGASRSMRLPRSLEVKALGGSLSVQVLGFVARRDFYIAK